MLDDDAFRYTLAAPPAVVYFAHLARTLRQRAAEAEAALAGASMRR